jgi:hypothetical protein
MMPQPYVNGNGSTYTFQPARRIRTRLAQRAVLAAQSVLAGQVPLSYAARLFYVSRRSIGRGQLLLCEGNPELVADTLEGQYSLTEAEAIVLDGRAIVERLRVEVRGGVEPVEVRIG